MIILDPSAAEESLESQRNKLSYHLLTLQHAKEKIDCRTVKVEQRIDKLVDSYIKHDL